MHDGQWQRVVVKVGTSLLTYPAGGINFDRVERLVRQLADLHQEGRQVVLVTSGAIGTGLGRLGLSKRPTALVAKQALAAVGQGLLLHTYEKLFAEYGVVVGQILLTREDLEHPERRRNAQGTMEQLLQWRVIPIVNENDTVATEEIKVGENDTLSARVAVLCGADVLIMLSDVDGLYPADPRTQPGQEVLHVVDEVTDALMAGAGGPGTDTASGGMRTKLVAARICQEAGVDAVVTSGHTPGVLRTLVESQGRQGPGTLFPTPLRRQTRRESG